MFTKYAKFQRNILKLFTLCLTYATKIEIKDRKWEANRLLTKDRPYFNGKQLITTSFNLEHIY